MWDSSYKRMNAVTGDERTGGWQLLADLDPGGVETDLLVGFAQCGRGEVGIAVVLAPTGERDLACVPSEVCAPLRENESWFVWPPIERQQDCRVDWPSQMMTWTVPPSTDQAAPLT